MSIMERQRLMAGRDAALGVGDILAGTMGVTNKSEKPSGLSSWCATSFMRSIRMASSSSPLVSDENFLKGLPGSAELCGVRMSRFVTEVVDDMLVEETTVLLEPADGEDMEQETAVTGFTGDKVTCVLAGERSRLSLRGAQLIGTLKLKRRLSVSSCLLLPSVLSKMQLMT